MSFWDDEDMAGYVPLRHYDPEVDAVWTIDEEGNDSLQIVYQRNDITGRPDENFWLYPRGL